jgi:catechol 1,2-dioxygenase
LPFKKAESDSESDLNSKPSTLNTTAYYRTRDYQTCILFPYLLHELTPPYMHRRNFIKDSSLVAVAIGAFGKLTWEENHFIGDSPTTTDILGPFYRPDAPFRTNLNPPRYTGQLLHFSGTIYKEDGKTPVPNALVEIWHCDPEGIYDNTSSDFLYRASQKVSTKGSYRFTTSIPVPYPVGSNSSLFRPAHIHMLISSEGNQDLITQVYIKGDPHLETDPSTKSPLAVNRILDVRKINPNEREIVFNIILRKEYLADDSVFEKVSGTYKLNDGSLIEFYRDGDLLFYKVDNQIRGGLAYSGDNTFSGAVNDTKAVFQLLPGGKTEVSYQFIRRSTITLKGTKI